MPGASRVNKAALLKSRATRSFGRPAVLPAKPWAASTRTLICDCSLPTTHGLYTISLPHRTAQHTRRQHLIDDKMAAPRLPFLWPMLYRSVERAALESRPAIRRQALHLSARRRQQTVQLRYGTANEPPPRVDAENKLPLVETSVKVSSKKADQKASADAQPSLVDKDKPEPTPTEPPTKDSMIDAPEVAPPPPLSASIGSAAEDKPVQSLLDSVSKPDKADATRSDASLSEMIHDEHQPPIHAPHIETPRYVHNFDTYGLVKSLEESGWRNEQSVSLMKAMRLMLADNLDLAREALVSKSQVENESYLFKAACSELRMEVQTKRRGEQEKMRAERAQLQHEVDIINQKFGQDSATLKDDLKGMFDDRKMNVRNEQREMEGKIAELNYKITVNLQADSRSDIEGLRWIMTRRVIITLLVIVIMVLSSLKLYSNAVHEREMEAKRKASMRSVGTQADDGTSSDAGLGVGSQTIEGHIVVNSGDNPAYVSLG